jgi:hypothetical protein
MEKYIATIGAVNFRNAPGTTGTRVIKTLPNGTVLLVLGTDATTGWYHARLEDGTEGYITYLSKYVKEYVPAWEAVEKSILELAESFILPNGNVCKYVFGAQRYRFGQAPSLPVFDCSSLQRYVYGTAAGITLGADSRQQSQQGIAVDLNSLRTGDLLFFAYESGYVHHVAQYVNVDGKDRLLHTFSTTSDVFDKNLKKLRDNCGGPTYSDFSPGSYWRNRATSARRVINV